MENNKIFLAGMEALRDSRNFTIRKKQYPLLTELSNSLHWHDFCEIDVITGGSGQHLVDGVCYPLHRGCAYLLTAKDFHNVREDPENPLSLYNINFNDQILPAGLANEFNQSDDLFCVTFSEEDIRRVEQLAEDLLQEYEGSRLHRDEMILARFEELVIRIIRQKQAERHSDPAIRQENTNLPVNQVISYLKKNFREPITLGQCAKMVYLTPNYFGELFRNSVHMSFSDYLKYLRFDHAVNLLHSTQESVDRISQLSGFHSAAYFIVLFRKHFGITPSQYRKLDRDAQIALMREKQRQLNHLHTPTDT